MLLSSETFFLASYQHDESLSLISDDQTIDYGTDFEDGVPVVAEGTTFNIHGGRDVFAKRSPVKTASVGSGKPTIAKKPSLDKMRARSIQRQNTLDQGRYGYLTAVQKHRLYINMYHEFMVHDNLHVIVENVVVLHSQTPSKFR